jgi:hypothetical protein
MFESYGLSGTGDEKLRPNPGEKRGRPLDRWAAALSGAVTFIGGGFIFFGKISVLWLFPLLPFLILSLFYSERILRSKECLTVEEALAEDPRPPILYLRPFRADRISFSTPGQRIGATIKSLSFFVLGPLFASLIQNFAPASRRRSAEEFLVSLLDPLGPVIAIGRPKESMPPLGAARMYLGDEWKDVVQDYLKRSQLILMFAGTTTHFSWELQNVFRNDPFVPTILILPFFQHYRQPVVDKFVNLFQTATGLELSKDLRKTRAVYSAKAGEIAEIRDLETPEEKTLNELNPFLGPVAQIMELSRPGWAAEYAQLARDNHRSNMRWLYGGVTALLLLLVCSLVPFYWIYKMNREADIADRFFTDVLQHTNPCTDANLSKLVPDPGACTQAASDDGATGKNICEDPRFVRVFPDPDICQGALRRAYLQSVSAGNK